MKGLVGVSVAGNPSAWDLVAQFENLVYRRECEVAYDVLLSLLHWFEAGYGLSDGDNTAYVHE